MLAIKGEWKTNVCNCCPTSARFCHKCQISVTSVFCIVCVSLVTVPSCRVLWRVLFFSILDVGHLGRDPVIFCECLCVTCYVSWPCRTHPFLCFKPVKWTLCFRSWGWALLHLVCGAWCTASRSVISAEGSLARGFVTYAIRCTCCDFMDYYACVDLNHPRDSFRENNTYYILSRTLLQRSCGLFRSTLYSSFRLSPDRNCISLMHMGILQFFNVL